MKSSSTQFWKDSSNKVAIECVLGHSGKHPACLGLEALLGRRWDFQYDNKNQAHHEISKNQSVCRPDS